MNKEQFLKEFQEWRAQNGYPKRDACRDMFKQSKNMNENILTPDWLDYINKQEKPAMFLDSLFKKGNSVCDSDPKEEKEIKVDDNKIKKDIINIFYNYIKATGEVPEFRDLNLDIKPQKYFSSIRELFDECGKSHDLSQYVLNESIFTDKYNEDVIKEVKLYNRFIISSAVVNKKANKLFVDSIKNYCDKNDALCLIMPCQDVHNRKSEFKYSLDPILRDFPVISKDLYLNDNIYLSNIKVSAKQILPTTGLHQFTTDGSCIVVSPQLSMVPIPNPNRKTPNVIMTPGACTYPDYDNDLYMSDRINKLAEYNHDNSAIIVEIENDTIFHFRQVEMGSNGEFIDLGIQYNPDGTTELVEHSYMVIGDSHFSEHEPTVLEKTKEMITELRVKDLVLHDIFGAGSVSHHNANRTITRAIQAEEDKISLKEEAFECAEEVIGLLNITEGDLYIAYSNHHTHLAKYLEDGRYAKDPINLYYSLDLVKAMIDGIDPFEDDETEN